MLRALRGRARQTLIEHSGRRLIRWATCAARSAVCLACSGHRVVGIHSISPRCLTQGFRCADSWGQAREEWWGVARPDRRCLSGGLRLIRRSPFVRGSASKAALGESHRTWRSLRMRSFDLAGNRSDRPPLRFAFCPAVVHQSHCALLPLRRTASISSCSYPLTMGCLRQSRAVHAGNAIDARGSAAASRRHWFWSATSGPVKLSRVTAIPAAH